MVSGPELVRHVEVLWINPDLGRLPIADVPDLNSAVFQLPAGPFAAGRVQRDSVLIVGNDVVQLKVERAACELEGPARPGSASIAKWFKPLRHRPGRRGLR